MSDHILFEQRGPLGLITLNRPQALNAANIEMARAMLQQLDAWASDANIAHVAIQGAGKAFCAGGDIRAIYGMAGDAMRFFRPEYDLCRMIQSYPKPYIALMDGITFGGGVGISIYGNHRIATPNTLWAMPECAIGFYPDIGATWFLPRLPGEVGTYLALTSARLKADDLLALGIATGFTDDPENFIQDLARSPLPHGRGLGEGVIQTDTLTQPALPVDLSHEGEVIHIREAIDRCFAHDTIEDIIAALEAEGGAWAGQTLAALRRASPTSLKVTLAQMRRGKNLDFAAAIDLEYRLTQNFLARSDFFEGVRAALIDRDNAPRWQPATLAEVTPALVDSFFADDAGLA